MFRPCKQHCWSLTYIRKLDCLATRPSPPGWHVHLPSHSAVRGTLVGQPVDSGKVVTVPSFISPSLGYTRREACSPDPLPPRDSRLMYPVGVGEVEVVDGYLDVDWLIWVKRVLVEWNLFTSGRGPGLGTNHFVAAFLEGESWNQMDRTLDQPPNHWLRSRTVAKVSRFLLNHSLIHSYTYKLTHISSLPNTPTRSPKHWHIVTHSLTRPSIVIHIPRLSWTDNLTRLAKIQYV